ncbi:MAG: hypothetical protein ACXACY_26315 [Candidatus Hodarchaeales archaeon]|jgi:hypothetical protein
MFDDITEHITKPTEPIIKKKNYSHTVLICAFCKSYNITITRSAYFTQADGTNIKEELTCEDCENKWHIVWTRDAKTFIRIETR